MKKMDSETEVVLMYAIVPAKIWEDVKLPPGCFAKAMHIGPMLRLTDQQTCKGWGAIIAASLSKLAGKVCPVASRIINPMDSN